jgi:hypothetical protein
MVNTLTLCPPYDSPFVIASEAKQSMPPRKERMDCFVASLLAMTMRTALAYNAANTAFAISAVPLLPPNSIGLMPSA